MKGKKRKELGQRKFKKAAQTLRQRIRNKLIEKVSWYKPKKGKVSNEGIQKGFSKKTKERSEKKTTPQAVMYVPYTHGSQLAKEIRKVVEDLKPYTNISLKVVERAGKKIVDQIHRSNPWENSKCERDDCVTCQSSQNEKKEKFRSCKRRSIMYETWCQTCVSRLRKKIGLEKEKGNEKEIGKEKEEIGKKRKLEEDVDLSKEKVRKLEEEVRKKTYKYIGESSRSAYERGLEHLKDVKNLDSGSHMLKHIIRHHLKESEPTEFRMKVISSHYSAFNRQISEAVLIKKNEGKYLLNSKAEYNRCSLPSIRTNEKKSEWELSEMSDEEFEAGISYIQKYRKENLMPNIEIVKGKKSEKNVKVKIVENDIVKESTEKKLLDECEKIIKWNSNRWEVRENTERVKRMEEQSMLEKEYRLSRAKILKENFIKKHNKNVPKKAVSWSKEKIEFRKKSWRKYREVIPTIDVHERLDLIGKLMVNVPERKPRTGHESNKGICDNSLVDCDRVTELSPASPFKYSVISKPKSDAEKPELSQACSLSINWLNSDIKNAESSPACPTKLLGNTVETELLQPPKLSFCPDRSSNCDVRMMTS